MNRRRTRGTGIAFEQSLRSKIALVAGVILIGSVSSVPAVSASLVKEVGGIVGSTVRSVPSTVNAAPSLPNAAPPTAPVPIPALPHAPVRLPTKATPAPLPSGAGSGASAPSADGIAGAARNSAGSVTGAGRGTASPAASAGSGGGGASVAQSGSGTRASRATPGATGTASSAPPSIDDAEVAALQRWFARIWPAIALGDGESGRGWLARAIDGDLLRPAVAAVARLLFLGPPIVRAVADSPTVGLPATANAPQSAPPDNAPASSAPPPAADGTWFIFLAALSALLAFALWKEFHSTL